MFLYSTHISPAYVPPLPIADRQIVVGPRFATRAERGIGQPLDVPEVPALKLTGFCGHSGPKLISIEFTEDLFDEYGVTAVH
jgi:hypothetical protein